jgi:multidrug resistance protein, MATE family
MSTLQSTANRDLPDGVPSLFWIEVRTTLALALPIALTQIAQMAMNTTDVLMTGWLGPVELAAGQLGHTFLFPLMITMLGTMFATSAMFAQELGARRYKGVRRTFRQGLWVIATMSVPMLTLLLWSEEILLTMGQDPVVVQGSADYLSAAMWGMPFMVAFGLLRNFIAAHSRPKPALYILMVGLVINAIADYVLIFGSFGAPRLELFGLGIATTIVQITMFFILLVFVLRDRRYKRYMLLARFFKPDWPRYREVWVLGAPIAGAKVAESGLFAASSFMIGLIGVNQLAGHSVAIQFVAIAFMIPFGVAQAATVRVGINIGRGNPAAAKLAGRVSMGLGVLVMLPSALLYMAMGEELAGLFFDLNDPDSAQAVSFAVSFLAIGALFQLADGGQAVAAGALRGIKDTRVPMAIALVGYWGFGIGSAVLLAFPLDLGGRGVWMGLAIGLAVVWVALVVRFERLTYVRLPHASSNPSAN